MNRSLKLALLVAAFAGAALCMPPPPPPSVPEIDPGSAASALALLAGVLLVFRARRRS